MCDRLANPFTVVSLYRGRAISTGTQDSHQLDETKRNRNPTTGMLEHMTKLEPTTSFRPNEQWEVASLAIPIYAHVIAVTGTIGSGKSTVVRLFAEHGAFVQSADLIARDLVLPGEPALAEITDLCGKEILLPDGGLDRRKLREIVFAQPEVKSQIESILHPRIQERSEERFRKAFASGQELLVYEVPLLFESGLNTRGFKSIITVTAEDEICISRVMARDDCNYEEAKRIVAAQFPTELKRKGADIVIENSGSPDRLVLQVEAAVKNWHKVVPFAD